MLINAIPRDAKSKKGQACMREQICRNVPTLNRHVKVGTRPWTRYVFIRRTEVVDLGHKKRTLTNKKHFVLCKVNTKVVK